MRLHVILLAATLAAPATGCSRSAARQGSVGEPSLTNPVRAERWRGAVADVAEIGHSDRKYHGGFRLPLTEDWSWGLPDEGRWAVSRLELGTPAAHGELVLAGSSRRAGLFVLDRSDGRLVRRIDMPGPIQAQPLALTESRTEEIEVTLEGTNHVVTRTREIEEHKGWLIADTFGTVLRLDANLDPVWAAPYAAGAGIYRAPIVDGDQVLLATTKDQIVAIGADDGLWRWSYKREVARTSMELAILGAPAPVVDGAEVIAGFSDGVVAGLDRTNGRVRWEVRVGDGQFPDIEAEVIIDDGVLVAAAFGGPLLGLDRATRRVLWTMQDAGAASSMAASEGTVFTSDSKGRVRAVEIASGTELWMWELPNKILSPPRLAGGSVLVGDVDGTLYAIDRFTGVRQWRWNPADGTRLAGVAVAPAVYGRQVLFPTAGGALISLIGESGLVSDQREEPDRRLDRVIGW